MVISIDGEKEFYKIQHQKKIKIKIQHHFIEKAAKT